MKKSLLFLFLLVLGVTQGWAVDYLTLPTSGGTLEANKIYSVTTTNRTALPALSVPDNSTVTIYIAKGKTLTVKSQTAGKPAIAVPATSTLVLTGGGTLRVYGGKAGAYHRTNGTGGVGAAPGIGGVAGEGGVALKDGGAGTAMGTVYVRGNVYVRAARGTSYGRRATTGHGADGLTPTYAIGGGAGGGSGKKGSVKNGGAGGDGTLYVEKTARVAFLNGRRRTPTKFTRPNVVTITYNANGGSGSSPAQTINEYGFVNVKENNFTYVGNKTDDKNSGLSQVTSYKFAGWNTAADGNGVSYANKDLILADGIGTTGKTDNIILYAQWDKTNAYVYYEIWNADQLRKFEEYVNNTKIENSNKSNCMLMADIDMSESAWNESVNAGKWTGGWKNWVPIGDAVQDLSDALERAYMGTFDGNGHVVSNLVMSNPISITDELKAENTSAGGKILQAQWEKAFGRAGLIGYAKGATIKNVVVKNAIIYGKWQVAAVCGRLDNGSLTNCGSYGDLNLNCVAPRVQYQYTNNRGVESTVFQTISNYNKEGLESRVIAGVVVTDAADVVDDNPISSVWSTYNLYRHDKPATANNTIVYYVPRKNYVVGCWYNSKFPNRDENYRDYTQNAPEAKTGITRKNWVYVDTVDVNGVKQLNAIASNGALCYALNDKKDGGTAWTQTFNEDDKNDETRNYDECPRPTSEGLAVYKDADDAYSNHIYTISFDSNGGTECDDVFVTRRYEAKSRTYPSPLPTPTLDGSSFVGWFTELNGETQFAEASEATVQSDITLYAKWLGGPQTITVNANQDPQNEERYYCTFYYGEQAYQMPEDVVAYIATRNSDSNDLIMRSLKDGNGNVSRIIPAGEAVILKAKSNTITLTAVDSEAEVNENNLLYGSDEDVSVMDVSDNIPSSDESESAADVVYNNCFIFSGEQGALGFYPPKSETLAAHKAYILLDGVIITDFSNDPEQQAKSLKMIFEDEESEATGISENFVAVKADKAIYNINGVRLSKLQKGLNIVGGKKIFVK